MKCVSIQEEIAWGKPLVTEAQKHLLNCPECSQVALELAELNSLIEHSVEIPEGFADRVMLRIQEPVWGEKIQNWIGLRFVQLGFAAVGASLALFNIIRFVIGIILPTSA